MAYQTTGQSRRYYLFLNGTSSVVELTEGVAFGENYIPESGLFINAPRGVRILDKKFVCKIGGLERVKEIFSQEGKSVELKWTKKENSKNWEFLSFLFLGEKNEPKKKTAKIENFWAFFF